MRDCESMENTTELATIDRVDEQIQRIQVSGDKWRGALAKAPEAVKTVTLARAIRDLNDLMADWMVAEIMPLQNDPNGFLTDRNPEMQQGVTPYGEHIVRRVWVSAELCGARMVGNEVNIISSRMYLTKNYFYRKMWEVPGLKDLVVSPDLPVEKGQICTMAVKVSYTLNGKLCEHKVPVVAKLSRGWSVEMVQGKAERKALARVLPGLMHETGWRPDEPDDGTTVIDAEFRTVSQEDPRAAENDEQARRDADTAQNAAESEQWPEGGEELVEAFTKRLKEAKTPEQLNAIWRLMSDAQNAKRFTVGQASAMWRLYQDKVRAGE